MKKKRRRREGIYRTFPDLKEKMEKMKRRVGGGKKKWDQWKKTIVLLNGLRSALLKFRKKIFGKGGGNDNFGASAFSRNIDGSLERLRRRRRRRRRRRQQQVLHGG